jgi:uncharacterized protein
VNGDFESEGLRLARYLSVATTSDRRTLPGLILCHGFPAGPLDARASAGTFPELVDRIANDLGFAAMTFTFRGCGDSDGDFSLRGWVSDLRAAIDHLQAEAAPSAIWLAGTSTGGSLATVVAAGDDRISGVAALAARSDFGDWAAQPRRFLEHARDLGAVRTPGFPSAFDLWAAELRAYRPIDAAKQMAERQQSLLVLAGDADDNVPVSDARRLSEAHGAAELRVLPGGGHRLRHDPRAIAVLLGWLDRQRTMAG